MRYTRKHLIALLLIAVLLLPTAVQAGTDAPEGGILPCTYIVPAEAEAYTDHLRDGNAETTVTLYSGETLTVRFADGVRPDRLFLDFYALPDSLSLTFWDADGNRVDAQHVDRPEIQTLIPIPEGNAAGVTITATDKQLVLSECYPCTEAFVPPFPDADAHADVWIVLNRPEDELRLLGGLIAQLAGEHGLSVQVDYLLRDDGYRTRQCMEILREMGVARVPAFGRGREPASRTAASVYSALGSQSELLKSLTTRIRTLKPEIVITLDTSTEQERYADGVIADAVLTAAAYAAEAKHYPDTEPFSVRKVYTLSQEGKTAISMQTPLYAYDGVTADALADELYACYREERVFRRDMPDTVRFTLETSTVGNDKACNDLLEHLSTDRFAGYRVPTPSPIPTPEPTDTPEPTEPPSAAPTPEPTEPPAVVSTTVQTASAAPTLVPQQKTGLFSCGGKEETPQPTAAPSTAPTSTPEPTEAPTPTPTEQPTPEPTPEPTATPEPMPDPNDAYFLEGDGEAFELDFDNGHWWYRNNILSVDIVRVTERDSEDRPIITYAADIRMRRYTSYHSGVHSAFGQPWRYVRTEKAVFAITGDNLDRAEKEKKGLLLRKGVFYSNFAKADSLIIHEDMTLSVMHAEDVCARALMDSGIRDTYSFGPILVENGAIRPDLNKHFVAHPNPRCGIGMVEPGHWIAIVTDGRQPHYSYSISLERFAQMFIDRGCSVAYNLDGGSSAAMCIMGEVINKHLGPGTPDTQRPWVDALLFGYSEQVPTIDVPTVHDGFHH